MTLGNMGGTVGALNVKIGADLTNLKAGLRQMTQGINRTAQRLNQFGRRMTTRVTAPLVGVGGIALKTAANFESLRQSLDILTGSAEEGARNFERLKQFSAGTPFQLQDLTRAQNTLMGFSLSADEAFESMRMIGDIAAVTGGDIQSIAVAFGQAAAEGKLLTRDIRQFINQGVPAVKLLADSMGVAEDQIFDLASAGEITFGDLQRAFRDATTEGGMFADGMQKQSQTIAGMFSTLRDNVTIALGDLGENIKEAFNLDEVIPAVSQGIQTIVRRFNDLDESTRHTIIRIGAFAAAIGPGALGLSATITGIKALTTAMKGLSAATLKATAVVGGIAVVGLAAAVAVKQITDNFDVLEGTGHNALASVKNAAIDAAQGIARLRASMRRGLGLDDSFFQEEIAGLEEQRMDFVEVPETTSQIQTIADMLLTARQGVQDLRGAVADFFTDFTSGIDGASGAFDGFEAGITNIGRAAQRASEEVSGMLRLDGAQAQAENLLGGLFSEDEELSLSARLDERGGRLFVPDEMLQGVDRVQERLRELKDGENGITGLQVAIDQLGMNAVNTFGNEIGNAVHGLVSGTQSVIEAFDNMGQVFSNVAASIIADIARMTARMVAFRVISSLIPGFGQASAFAGFAGGVFGGFRASGGPVVPNRAYVVGERGPELFTPNTSGRILANGAMGGQPYVMEHRIDGRDLLIMLREAGNGKIE